LSHSAWIRVTRTSCGKSGWIPARDSVTILK